MAHAANKSGLPNERSSTVLLILDMVSRFDFPDGEATARAARRIAPHIARLKDRVRSAGFQVIYVNDNPGRWRSDAPALVREAAAQDSLGTAVLKALRPTTEDYFILKPRHSAFFATPLATILEALKTRRLILTGVSSHQCVLFTANDAHVRQFELVVPSDCIAAPSAADTRLAIRYFRKALSAAVMPQSRWRS
jgi:nicotinamidase-related amidase